MADKRDWSEENDAFLMIKLLGVLASYKVPDKLQKYDKDHLDLVVYDIARYLQICAVDLQSSPNDDSMVMTPKASIREYIRDNAGRLMVSEADAGDLCDLICNNVLQSELARKYHRYGDEGEISGQKTVFNVAESTFDEIGLRPGFVMALAQVTDLLTCLGVDRLDIKTYRVKRAILDKNVDMVVQGLAEIRNDMMLEFAWISSQKQKVRSSFSTLDLPALAESLSIRQGRYRELSESTMEARTLLQKMRSAAEEERSLTPAEIDEIARADDLLDSCIAGYGALVSKMGRLLEELYDVSARQISYDVGDMYDFDREVTSRLPAMTADKMAGALDHLLLPILLNPRLGGLFPLDAFCSVEPMKERAEEAGFLSTTLSEGLLDEEEDDRFEGEVAEVASHIARQVLANHGSLPLSRLLREAPEPIAEKLSSQRMLYRLFTAPISSGSPICSAEGARITALDPPETQARRELVADRHLEFSELVLTADIDERGSEHAS